MRCPTCNFDNTSGAPFCAECGTRLSVASTPPVIGGPTGALPQQTILQGRYVIGQKLGQGGMGAVYRSADLRLSTVNWAIKEMSQAAITGPLERQQAREIFRQEAEMLAVLSHPNLPRVTDHFEQDGKAYLVMEFVPGETLLSVAQRERLPLPVARVLDWARQLCDALEYLHTQNPPIVFRDLKPANIMMTPNGQIKLIDFGIARVFKPGKERDTQAFGTVGYSAPEQFGRGQTDARSDIYSFGAMLHQLLTGYDPTSTPFRLPPANQINPQLPAYLSNVIAQATDSDPNRRFRDMRAFREALLSQSGQVIVQPNSQPWMAAQQGSHPPIGLPNSQPINPLSTPVQSQTTGMANGSKWIGIVSVGLMSLGAVVALLALGSGSEATAGFSALIGFLPVVGGPMAFVMGLVALLRPQTMQTLEGRRHAMIGVVTGVATLLLCCVTLMMIGSVQN